MEATTTTPTGAPFWGRMLTLFRSGVAHAYVLHGNVFDYVETQGNFYRLRQFLEMRLSSFDIVVGIDPASGLVFSNPAHRELFVKALGLEQPQQPAQGQGGVLANALRQQQPAAQQKIKLPTELRPITQLLDQLLTDDVIVEPAADERGKPKGVRVLEGDEAQRYRDTRAKARNEGREVESKARELTVAVIFFRGDLLLPEANTIQTDTQVLARVLNWARDPQIAQRHLLFIVAESHISMHGELRRDTARWEPIETLRPNQEERRRFIEFRLAKLQERGDEVQLDRGLTVEIMARLTGMLNREQIDDVIFRGIDAKVLTVELINDAKAEIISREFGDVMTVRDARFKFDRIGGYDYIKRNFMRYIVNPWRERGRLNTSGVLMMGPPGTGKTYLAEATAGEAGVYFVELALSKILGQYVGNSERNFDRLKRALYALGNCVVFVDEMEQTFQRGQGGASGGSQVDNRLFAAWLTFMEDPDRIKAGILVMGATNRPDLLDEAIISRMGLRVPVLVPTARDRAEIVPVLAREFIGVQLDTGTKSVIAGVVDNTEGWVGRDLRNLAMTAADLVEAGVDDTGPMEAGDALATALTLVRPSKKGVALQTALALDFCSDLRYLPPEWRDRADELIEAAPQEPTYVTAADEVDSRASRRRREL